ncbi:MAG: TolC family protein, partial [Armatimonadetes bacterium]|nr:TolC family protein [Armatimonadota bacterium]
EAAIPPIPIPNAEAAILPVQDVPGTVIPGPVLPNVEPDVLVASDLPLDLEPAIHLAYEQRPEVLSAANAVRIAERSVDLARRERRPDAALSGQFLFNPDAAGFGANEKSWNVVAQLSVPIYQGGIVRARVNEAQADVETARSTLEQVKQGVALEVRSALLDLQESARRRQTVAANVVQAREALRIAQVRFRAGVSTTVEVTDAQVAYIQALTNQVNAEYDHLSAEARLRRAVGRLVPESTRTQVQTKPGTPPPPVDSSVGRPGEEPSVQDAPSSDTPSDRQPAAVTPANSGGNTATESPKTPAGPGQEEKP